MGEPGGEPPEPPACQEVSAADAKVGGTGQDMNKPKCHNYRTDPFMVWKALPDNTTEDLTVYASGVKHYSATATPTKYQLGINFGGNDVADSNSDVMVGQLINPTCGWAGGGGPAITNFSWTVPGITFSDYVANANSGTLYTDFPKTNSGVGFYWVDNGSKQVSCTVQAVGQTLTVQTTFNVVRPSVNWVGAIQGPIAANYLYNYGGNSPNPWLHFGGSTGTDGKTQDGIVFTASNTSVYSNASFFVIQIGNMSITRCRSSTFSVTKAGSGLDVDGPLDSNGQYADSPGSPFSPSSVQVARSDNFQTYLMYQPAAPSRPVPLKLVAWNWSGAAIPNISPADTWTVISSNAVITINNSETFSHPQWVTNILDYNLTTNYTCP